MVIAVVVTSPYFLTELCAGGMAFCSAPKHDLRMVISIVQCEENNTWNRDGVLRGTLMLIILVTATFMSAVYVAMLPLFLMVSLKSGSLSDLYKCTVPAVVPVTSFLYVSMSL